MADMCATPVYRGRGNLLAFHLLTDGVPLVSYAGVVKVGFLVQGTEYNSIDHPDWCIVGADQVEFKPGLMGLAAGGTTARVVVYTAEEPEGITHLPFPLFIHV